MEHYSDVLEIHNTSYIRSFTSGPWYSKVFNPPITAQFLKDIRLQLRSGEILAVTGSGGSGKTTLLHVLSRRVQGTTGGSILLNYKPLSERTFQDSCAYVSFKQSLFNHLTVEETLKFQSALGLSSSITSSEKWERVQGLLHEFELEDYVRHRVGRLNESCRRKLLTALHLVRDPVLILIDEPLFGLEPLDGYNFMCILSAYVKRYHRMAVLSMNMPRSDIYPLIDRTVLLFFGEVVYSGYTKVMPQYFRHIGYPCPASENPCVYFTSLSTVDRETAERYVETQDQAVKLVDLFKAEGDPFAHKRGYAVASDAVSPKFRYSVPLCQYGRPNWFLKTCALFRRSIIEQSRSFGLLWKLCVLPAFGLILFLSCLKSRAHNSSTLPHTKVGILLSVFIGCSFSGSAVSGPLIQVHRNQYYQESWDRLYGGFLFSLSHVFLTFLVDVLPVFSFSAIVFWGCKLGSDVYVFLMLSALLYSCHVFAQLHTYCLMLFIKSAFKAVLFSMLLLTFHIVAASGFSKSFRDYQHGPSDWLYYVTFASPYRYAGTFLLDQLVSPINITEPCFDPQSPKRLTQNLTQGVFCRWRNGTDYLHERLYEEDLKPIWLNFALSFAFSGAFVILTILLFSIPMPYMIKRKFRIK